MFAPADPIDCRLLEDSPRDGAENMAIDEALLISADEMSKPTLRFYAWSRPTLSLGYFQKYAHRRYHPASRLCAVVRRSTGGGAIVHDRELTYSFIWPGCRLPGKEKLSRPLATEGLYQTVHEALIRVLGRWEVQAHLVADLATDKVDFLCFQRRSFWDMLIGDWKVLGSAQRRCRGALLQQGSLILAASPHAPEIPGLAELSGPVAGSEEIASLWAAEIATGLNLRLQSTTLENHEKERAEEIIQRKYHSPQWTKRR